MCVRLQGLLQDVGFGAMVDFSGGLTLNPKP